MGKTGGRDAKPGGRRARWPRLRGPVSVALFAVVLGASPSPPVVADARVALGPLARTDRLLGDVGGGRARLERLGLDLRLFYNQYLSGKPAGGGANPSGVFGHSGSYDFFARVDLDELAGWPGAQALLHVKGQYDRNLNADVGALSEPIDDADFDSPIYVDELWLQQALLEDRLRVRVGFSEQQTVFDRNAYANSEDRQFLASFLDNNAVVPLPNGLAATLLFTAAPWLELAAGVADADNRRRRVGFDTAFDGIDSLTGYFEVLMRSPWAGGGRRGDYRLGVFVDGRERLDFTTGRRVRGHVGVYASFDQQIWSARGDAFGGLGIFGRAGYADPDVNRIAGFWSLGFEWTGRVWGRRRDALGFGVYQTVGSSAYRWAIDPSFDMETGIELYYALRVLGWLVVTPDMQYIVNPGATGTRRNAFVGTLRSRVVF